MSFIARTGLSNEGAGGANSIKKKRLLAFWKGWNGAVFTDNTQFQGQSISPVVIHT